MTLSRKGATGRGLANPRADRWSELPDLSNPLAKVDPELRRSVYEAFQFGIELDTTEGARIERLQHSLRP